MNVYDNLVKVISDVLDKEISSITPTTKLIDDLQLEEWDLDEIYEVLDKDYGIDIWGQADYIDEEVFTGVIGTVEDLAKKIDFWLQDDV